MSPRCFTLDSPCCVLGLSVGHLCKSKPVHRAGHRNTQRGRDKHLKLTSDTYVSIYIVTSRATAVVQGHVDHFLVVCSHTGHQRPHPGVSGPAFAHYAQTIPQSWGNTPLAVELAAHPHCIALAIQWTLTRAKDLANRIDFLWVHQTICCELYLLDN